MAIVILICGWLFKAACIQQGPDGAGGVSLDQGGQRPWITACYNDAVPLFGSHRAEQRRPAVRDVLGGQRRDPVHGVPGRHRVLDVGDGPAVPRVRRVRRRDGHPAGAVGRRRVLHHRRDLPRADVPVGGGVNGEDRPPADLGHRDHVPVAAADRACLHQLGPAGHRYHRRRDARLGAEEAGAGRCADRPRRRGEAVSAAAARAVADPVPAGRKDGRLDAGRDRRPPRSGW